MRYVARIRLENFQSHASTELDLGPGFNVVVGPSDNGKTAVLRGLRWALYNEPGGTDFIRRGARECRVEVTMSDGTRILRERTPSRNRYVVQGPGAEPQVFEGFGVRPPAEVLRAHGMPPIALDTDHRVLLNLGTQLEGPFLLSETPSLRARAIGRLLGVHVVDAAARLARRDVQAMGQRARQLERDVARLDELLAPYADLDRWEEGLAAAEQRLRSAAALAERARKLTELDGRLAAVAAEAGRLQQTLARLGRVAEAGGLAAQAAAAQERLARLGRLGSSHAAMTAELQHLGRRLAAAAALPPAAERVNGAAGRAARLGALEQAGARLEQVRQALATARRELVATAGAETAAAAVTAAADRFDRLARLQERLAQLEDLRGRQARGRQYLQEQGAEIRRLAHDYEHLLHRQGVCPTCLSPITPEVVRRIARELTGSPGKEAETDAS